MENELSEKQKKFCVEYAIEPNITQAAIKAGYPKKYAEKKSYLFLRNPKIQSYIKELISDEEKYFFYSRMMRFKNLERAQKLALNKKTSKITKDGEIISVSNPDINAFLKAEELKGRLNGLYVERSVNITGLSVNSMGSVFIDDNKLELKIGKEIEESDKNS